MLLVMGLGAQGIIWPDELCHRLAAGGRYVIRYDNRDTGRSSRVDFAASPYTVLEFARAGDMIHTTDNHTRAVLASRGRSGLVGSITTPTLVIHGTEDRVAPFAHGKALAAASEGSVFLPIEGMGHEMPSTVLPRICAAILRHTGEREDSGPWSPEPSTSPGRRPTALD